MIASKVNGVSVESYAHLMAKEIFAGWLRDLARYACRGDDCTVNGRSIVNLGGICWEVDRNGPHFGIWTEYPIGRFEEYPCLRHGLVPVWDEEWYGEKGKEPWKNRPPTYDELVHEGRPPEFIVDVAVQHKSRITYAIEIVHKNPPTDRKIKAFYEIGIHLVTIPAAWVLGQIAPPNDIPREFFSPGCSKWDYWSAA